MATFVKDSLFPSQFYGLSPTGKRVRVAYSPKDINHLNRRLKDMIAAGLQIPVSKEHQSTAKPMSVEEFERYQAEKAWATCGWVKDGDISPDGTLSLTVEVPDEEDARRVAVIKYVSPEIVNNYMDGNGRVWQGLSVTHLAVTPRPVQHKQSPFERIQLSLSHPNAVRLSLGGNEMGDEYEDDFMDETEGTGEEVSEDGDTEEYVAEEPEVESGPNIPELVDLMRDAFQIDIAGHVTTPEEFVEHMYTAALTAKAHQEGGMGEEEGITGSDEYSDAEEVPQDVMMSMLRQENAALTARVTNEERAKLVSRVDSLLKSGRIGKKKHQELKSAVSGVRLSLGENGSIKTNSVLALIEAFESNDAPMNRTARLGLQGYEHDKGVAEVSKPSSKQSQDEADKKYLREQGAID